MPEGLALAAIASGVAAQGAGSIISASKAGPKMIPSPPPAALFPQLQNQYIGALGGPGGVGATSFGSLGEFAKTGMPTDIGPLFESLVASRKRFTDIGRSNILEQFGAGGMRYGSDLMNKLVDYEGQLGKDYASILADLVFRSSEAARQRQLQASSLGVDLFREPAMAFYPTAVLSTGAPSAVGAGLSNIGSNLTYLAILSQLGIIPGMGGGQPTPTTTNVNTPNVPMGGGTYPGQLP
jgi:hypothetical protein